MNLWISCCYIPFWSLILLICIISLFLLITLNESVSNLLIFSQNQLCFIDLFICLFISILLFQPYAYFYCLCFGYNFLFLAFKCAIKWLVWDLCNILMHTLSTMNLPLCPISLFMLCIHFHSTFRKSFLFLKKKSALIHFLFSGGELFSSMSL